MAHGVAWSQRVVEHSRLGADVGRPHQPMRSMGGIGLDIRYPKQVFTAAIQAESGEQQWIFNEFSATH